jgi:hypothetical protein
MIAGMKKKNGYCCESIFSREQFCNLLMEDSGIQEVKE